MKLSEIIKRYLKEHKMTQQKLSEISGINKGTISLWVNEKGPNGSKALTPSVNNLKKLATAMGISLQDLTGMMDSDTSVGIDGVITETGGGQSIFDMASNILPVPQTRKVPMLGSISCGEPVYADQEFGQIETDIKCDFCLRASGDSMIGARIHDGDLVYCRKQDDVYNGEVAVVIIGDEATLKRFYNYGDTVVLRPENPKYQEQVYTGDQLAQIRVLGKAVAFRAPVQ